MRGSNLSEGPFAPVRLSDVYASLASGCRRFRSYRISEDGELEKQCSSCHEWWPADTEFYWTNARGCHSDCKACSLERYGFGFRRGQQQQGVNVQ